MVRHVFLLAPLALLAPACDCGDDAVGPCLTDSPLEGCGDPCASHAECSAGLYCGADGCTADCTPTSQGICAPGLACDTLGRCANPDVGDGGVEPIPDGGECPHIHVDLEALVPEVLLLLDQSGSMDEDFGNTDRWNAMVEALVDPDVGVVPQLQDVVRFGATLYTGYAKEGGECPALLSVPPALSNLGPIETLLDDNGPAGDTPTGESVDAVVSGWPDDPDGDPVARVIVLATDGEPDTCAQPNPQLGQPESIAAVQNAYGLGIRTFVLSLGNDVGAGHLQDLANAGSGLPVDGPEDAVFYTANDPAELQAAFEDIIGRARSCLLTLEGTLDLDEAPEGEVVLNGVELGYDDPNGWRVVDAHTIELVGDACTTFLEADVLDLSALFPCGAVLF